MNCEYFRVPAEDFHALVCDGKRGKKRDIQYLKCQACQTRFSSRLNTPLYRLKTDPERVTLVLLYLAEGCDISVLVHCTRHSEATVTRWLERMGRHSQRLHDGFFRQLTIPLLQLDELHARVRWVGVRWLWVALDPISKIIPAIHLGGRKTEDGMHLVHEMQEKLHRSCVPAFTTDGLSVYFYALTAHFGRWFLPERARKARWRVSKKLLHGQLVKKKRRRKLVAQMRMAQGDEKDLHVLLAQHGFRTVIQTAFIERLNLTIWRGASALMRKTWAYAQTPEHLLLHVEWWRGYYHFVRMHESLAVQVPGLRHRQKRTPAMAAGLTRRPWTVADILKRPLLALE